MKHSTIANSLALIILAGCGADLVVSGIQATGTPTINADNSAEVPLRVVVENTGNQASGNFKVSTQYTGGPNNPTEKFTVAYSVPGQPNIWYPEVPALAAGASTAFDGKVTFHPSVHGVTVALTALADSCSGDEFMPTHCRVDELKESNNESAPLSVALP